MDITISRPNLEGDHTINGDGEEIAPYDQLSLPTQTLKEIRNHLLWKGYSPNEFEDLYCSIVDELQYRGENNA